MYRTLRVCEGVCILYIIPFYVLSVTRHRPLVSQVKSLGRPGARLMQLVIDRWWAAWGPGAPAAPTPELLPTLTSPKFQTAGC